MGISKDMFKAAALEIRKIRDSVSSLEKREKELKPTVVAYVKENGTPGKMDTKGNPRFETDDRIVEVEGLKVHNCLSETEKPNKERVKDFISKMHKMKPLLSTLIVTKTEEVVDETQFEKLVADGIITDDEIKNFALVTVKPSYKLDIYASESGWCKTCQLPVFKFDKFCSACGTAEPFSADAPDTKKSQKKTA